MVEDLSTKSELFVVDELFPTSSDVCAATMWSLNGCGVDDVEVFDIASEVSEPAGLSLRFVNKTRPVYKKELGETMDTNLCSTFCPQPFSSYGPAMIDGGLQMTMLLELVGRYLVPRMPN